MYIGVAFRYEEKIRSGGRVVAARLRNDLRSH